MLKNRRARLQRILSEQQLDGIIFSNLLNIRYLSGFSGSEGALLVTHEAAWLLCDSRYTTQAQAETVDTQVRQFSEKHAAISSLTEELKIRRLGFEAAHITVAAFRELSKTLHECELVALPGDLDLIRAIKDSEEVKCLAAVARLASDALQATLELIKPGVSEETVARELEFAMRRKGADGRAFDFIVASGERGAMPHGRASSKLIESGELVTIDYGAALGGYYSDETVTVAVGDVAEPLRRIHQVVLSAHDRAIAAVKPGMDCRGLDAIARDYIAEQGYGEYFGHGLGHGVGLEIHEKPVLSPRSESVVEEGMVFTIEPGIYIPGLGGVRIEDTVVVTADGCQLLTQAPKGLIRL